MGREGRRQSLVPLQGELVHGIRDRHLRDAEVQDRGPDRVGDVELPHAVDLDARHLSPILASQKKRRMK